MPNWTQQFATAMAPDVSAHASTGAAGPTPGSIAWLEVSSRTASDWPMSVRTGPLGLQIAPLQGSSDSFFFHGARVRGMRSVFSAATVNGAELRRSAKLQQNPVENTMRLLVRVAASGSVFGSDATFRGGLMRVLGPDHDVCEQFAANSHICTLSVQQIALGLDGGALAAMADKSYTVTPMQSALLRSAVALLTEPGGTELSAHVPALDRYLASLAGLLLRTAVPVRADEPERLGSVRARTEAIISQQAADPLLTPASLAQQLCVSLRQLYRAFDGTESPAARIRHRRLELAAELLRANGSGSSVDKVAQQCGFVSSEYFSRAFRREFGVSPRAYRSAHRERVGTAAVGAGQGQEV